MGEQAVRVMRIVSVDPAAVLDGQGVGLCRFVDADGKPVDITGGGGVAVTWDDLPGKPAAIAAGADAAAARTAIGAGTSSVTVGTDAPKALATAAAAGTGAKAAREDHVHPLPATLTAAQAQTGTATTPAVITAKVLADEIDRRVAAAIAAIPAG